MKGGENQTRPSRGRSKLHELAVDSMIMLGVSFGRILNAVTPTN